MFENKKIIGEAGSFLALLHLLSRGNEGIIIISGMIYCDNYEFHLSNNQFLQGKDNKSGLKFTFKAFSATAITLGYNSGLDNIILEIESAKASRHHDHAGILADGRLAKMNNVSIFLKVHDDETESEKYYPALYLRHRVEATGYLNICASGLLATAISGNTSATAAIEIKGDLSIALSNSTKPTIGNSWVEIIDGTFNYSNLCINPPQEEFAKGYVIMSGQTELATKCLSSPVISVFDTYRKQVRVELFHNKINPKKTLLHRCLSFWD